MHETIETAD